MGRRGGKDYPFPPKNVNGRIYTEFEDGIVIVREYHAPVQRQILYVTTYVPNTTTHTSFEIDKDADYATLLYERYKPVTYEVTEFTRRWDRNFIEIKMTDADGRTIHINVLQNV